MAELIPGRGGRENATVGLAGCTIVGVGGTAQGAAAERGGGHMQRVGGGAGCVGGGGRVPGGDVVPDPGGGVSGGAGGVVPQGVGLAWCQRGVRPGQAGPPLGELGPGQVSGELAAPVPDRLPVPGGVAGERDGVSGDLAGVAGAVAEPDRYPGLVQPGEELFGAGGGGGGGGYVAAQSGPGRLAAPVAGSFAGLGTGRGAGRSAVGRSSGPQPVLPLGGDARVADPVAFVHDPGAGPVLAGQHRHHVDVVRAVPDRDPPHRVVFLPAWAQPGAVHHLTRDARPFGVRQQAVLGGGAHRAVPDRLGVPPCAERVVREPQQPGQSAEVPAAIGA